MIVIPYRLVNTPIIFQRCVYINNGADLGMALFSADQRLSADQRPKYSTTFLLGLSVVEDQNYIDPCSILSTTSVQVSTAFEDEMFRMLEEEKTPLPLHHRKTGVFPLTDWQCTWVLYCWDCVLVRGVDDCSLLIFMEKYEFQNYFAVEEWSESHVCDELQVWIPIQEWFGGFFHFCFVKGIMELHLDSSSFVCWLSS